MESLFTFVGEIGPFQLFGPGHLAAIGLLVLTIISLTLLRKFAGERGRKIFRFSLITWMFGWEAAWHVWSYYDGSWSIQTHLPLHICALASWLGMFLLATKNYTTYEVVYFVGIGGAMQAIFTPDTGGLGFPHFRAYQIFASHGGIIIAALYMTIVERYRPTLQSLKKVILWANIYMAFILLVNALLGSNYLFISYKPTDFYSILDRLAPWPWYILQFEIIGIAVFLLLYLPFILQDLRSRRASTP